jgi:putative ATP-binding cassette transporter
VRKQPSLLGTVLSLLSRVPLKTRSLTLALWLMAPMPMLAAFLLGWGEFPQVRGYHRFAVVIATLVLMGANFFLQKIASSRLYSHLEGAVADLRASIVRLSATSEPSVMASVGTERLDTVVNHDARLVTSMMPTLMLALEFVATVVVGVGYLGFRSPWILALFGVCALIASVARSRLGDTLPVFDEATRNEERAGTIVNDFLGGVREALVDRAKGLELADEASRAQEEAAVLRAGAGRVFGSSLALVFSLNAFVLLTARDLMSSELVMAVLIVLAVVQGRFGFVLSNQEQLRACLGAARRLRILELGLQAAPRVDPGQEKFDKFGQIDLSDVTFLRTDTSTETPREFLFGPVNVSLRRGTLTFIKGPNGSGKSTLIEILTGLRKPLSGQIRVDGLVIANGQIDAYRGLFSTVSANPHLTDRLYGHETWDSATADEWLKRLELPAEVKVDARREVTEGLSTGQKKRLALVRAILEKRPVLVLDEYTADQDASARTKFFNEVVPQLKAAGHTLVGVFHDEAFPPGVDQILQLRGGKVEPSGPQLTP